MACARDTGDSALCLSGITVLATRCHDRPRRTDAQPGRLRLLQSFHDGLLASSHAPHLRAAHDVSRSPSAPNKHRVARDTGSGTCAAKGRRGYYYTLEDAAHMLDKSEDDIKRLGRIGMLESSVFVIRKTSFDFRTVWESDYTFMYEVLGPEDVKNGRLCSRIELATVAHAHIELMESWAEIILAYRTGTAVSHAALGGLWSPGSHTRALATELGSRVCDWATFAAFVMGLEKQGKFKPPIPWDPPPARRKRTADSPASVLEGMDDEEASF